MRDGRRAGVDTKKAPEGALLNLAGASGCCARLAVDYRVTGCGRRDVAMAADMTPGMHCRSRSGPSMPAIEDSTLMVKIVAIAGLGLCGNTTCACAWRASSDATIRRQNWSNASF